MCKILNCYKLLVFVLIISLIFITNILAQINWTHVTDQPVLDVGDSGEWDRIGVFLPTVIKDSDTLQMWYNSIYSFQVGYAWSIDGTNWMKYDGNPVLSGNLSWEANKITAHAVIKEGDTLKMWYGAGGEPGLPGKRIGYAFSLDGKNWNKHPDPVLQLGPSGDWDDNYIAPCTVIKEDSLYKMWFWGGRGDLPSAIAQVGLAISENGIDWIKYDDPSTTAQPFLSSDPVLKNGESMDWDRMRVWLSSVLSTEWGYEMWYTGIGSLADGQWIGYATSNDGITWTKWPAPIISTNPNWASGIGYVGCNVLKFDNIYHMWYGNWKVGAGDAIRIGYATSPDIVPPYIAYSNHIVDDSQGNNNGRADSGEDVSLIVTLTNMSYDAKNVSATLTTNDPDVQLTQASANYGDLNRDQSNSNQNNPFIFSVSSNAVAHYSNFYLDITADNGYTHADSFQIIIGTPTILLVDDDIGNTYEDYYVEYIIPEHRDVSVLGTPSIDVLHQYKIVVWFTGDDRENTLTADEQAIIANFLDGGGRLLISGQDIGYDLVGDGSVSDSTFYADYLHAQFIADSSNTNITLGVSDDPIGNHLFVHFTGNFGGARNQTAPDVIAPIPPAETIIKYVPGMGGAALRYENEITGSRVVYLAFGFEGIAGVTENSARQLLENALTWLSGETAVKERVSRSILSKFYALKQNYPNPFNPTTIIYFQLPKQSDVEISIFNSRGQLIRTFASQSFSAGTHSIEWAGRDDFGKEVVSGIYFYNLKAGGSVQDGEGFSETRKMLLIR